MGGMLTLVHLKTGVSQPLPDLVFLVVTGRLGNSNPLWLDIGLTAASWGTC